MITVFTDDEFAGEGKGGESSDEWTEWRGGDDR